MGWREFILEYWFRIALIEICYRVVHLEIIAFSFRRWECIRGNILQFEVSFNDWKPIPETKSIEFIPLRHVIEKHVSWRESFFFLPWSMWEFNQTVKQEGKIRRWAVDMWLVFRYWMFPENGSLDSLDPMENQSPLLGQPPWYKGNKKSLRAEGKNA